eukprot:2210833-Alexandrium_andersonii.AAC.1
MPKRSATAQRRSTNAGSLSVLSKIWRWCPSRPILATAWPTVSSRKRPLLDTGRARIARESRSLMTRAVTDVPLPSLVRKQ